MELRHFQQAALVSGVLLMSCSDEGTANDADVEHHADADRRLDAGDTDDAEADGDVDREIESDGDVDLDPDGDAEPQPAGAPVVLFTDILSGPNTGGEDDVGCYLSIFGKRFGNAAELGRTTKVFINDIEVAAYRYLGPAARTGIQQLSVQPGPGVTSGSIRVTVNGQMSNVEHSFTVRAGKIFFVSASGNDETGVVGDVTQPFRSPNHIVDLDEFGAGDFIVVRGGTYDLDGGDEGLEQGRWVNAQKDGTPDRPITFYGYPGEQVTVDIDASVVIWQQPSSAENRDSWVIANLTDININTPVAAPIRIGGSGEQHTNNTRVVNVDIQGGGNAEAGASPFEIMKGSHNRILGVVVHDSSQTGPSRTHWIYLGYDMEDVEVGFCEIRDCAYGRAAFQIHTDGPWSGEPRIDNVVVHDCLIHDVPAQAFLVGSNTGRVVFFNNVVYNANQNDQYDSAVFSLRGNGGARPELYNNTFYAAGGGDDGGMLELGITSTEAPETVVARNNIFFLTDSTEPYFTQYAGFDLANVESDHNLWYGSAASLPPFADQRELAVDPGMVDPEGGDFSLAEGSMCIDSGVQVDSIDAIDSEGISRPQGAAWDIGALEHTGGL